MIPKTYQAAVRFRRPGPYCRSCCAFTLRSWRDSSPGMVVFTVRGRWAIGGGSARAHLAGRVLKEGLEQGYEACLTMSQVVPLLHNLSTSGAELRPLARAID